VEAVREVEEQRQCDHQHNHQNYGIHRSLSLEKRRRGADEIGDANEQFCGISCSVNEPPGILAHPREIAERSRPALERLD
jgi:hypothetical protein